MSRKILAVDPGSSESAYCIWDGQKIIECAKVPNEVLLSKVRKKLVPWEIMVVEQIKSYGSTMGDSMINTIFFSGRLAEACPSALFLIPRKTVATHLCGTSKANDSAISCALVDRFAPNTPNKGKGNAKNPGFFFGFAKDMWSAFAIAVTYWDIHIDKVA